MKYSLFIFAILLSGFSFAQLDSLQLHYKIGYSDITEKHEAQITTFFSKQDSSVKYQLSVSGSADYLGRQNSNKILSDKRVEKLVHLINNQYAYFIDTILTDSKGEIDNLGYRDVGGGVQDHRIVILKLINPLSNVEELVDIGIGEKLILRNLNFYGARHILMKRSVPN